MKIVFDKSTLMSALIPAAGLVPGHNTAAAIDGILFECPGEEPGSCRICAYDMEKGIRTSIPTKYMDDGKFILNTQKILQIVRSLPDGDIEIDIDESLRARISSGASFFEIMGTDGKDFPGLPLLSGDRNYTFSGGDFRSIIQKTMVCVKPNDVNAAYTGVFFKTVDGTMTIVGCDGYRMAICEKEMGEGAPDSSVIIPVKILMELMKVIGEDDSVTLSLARKHAIFNVNGVLYFCRLIDTEYMNYAKGIERALSIPDYTEVFLSAAELRASLERASIITEDKLGGNTKPYVKLEFIDRALKISSSSTGGSINDEIPCAKTGGDVVIAFSCRYLLDALRSCPEAYTLKIRLTTSGSGIIIEEARGSGIFTSAGGAVPEGYDRPDSDGDEIMPFLYYIMPKRVVGL